MSVPPQDKFAAGAQGLGYIYQGRYALLKILQLPETSALFLEKDDDVEIVEEERKRTLASLKHKAKGDRISDLSTDFWKSVRIWLTRYEQGGRRASTIQFGMFTTSAVAADSFLSKLLPTAVRDESLLADVNEALARTESDLIRRVGEQYHKLSEDEQSDFLSRVTIIDNSPRIDDIPGIIIGQFMRTVRREARAPLFERLEGWWTDVVIGLLTGERVEPIRGSEVSDKLSALADEYKSDNLPITFRGKRPTEGIDPDGDPRLFITQLRQIALGPGRIQGAILDYYRAFEERSAWVREDLLFAGELEQYEERLIDEWTRYKEIVFEALSPQSDEQALVAAGQTLYRWAEMETAHLKIRERVTEPYVIRGGFHILANEAPEPRIYWHPRFLERLHSLLAVNE
jgi:hypothetical protein